MRPGLRAAVGLSVLSLFLGSAAFGSQPHAALQLESPLRVAAGGAGGAGGAGQMAGTALELDAHGYAALQNVRDVRLTGVPLGGGQHVDLDLRRFEVLAPGAQIIAADGNNQRQLPRPDLVLLRGTVAGAAESSVYLSLSPAGSNGWITLPDQTWVISTPVAEAGADGGAAPTLIYNLTTLPDGAIDWLPFQCGTAQAEREHPRADRFLQDAKVLAGMALGSAGVDQLPCRRIRIAIDSDWQFTGNVFGGNATNSAAYAVTLMGAVTEIYVREVNTMFEIVYLRVWESSNTPYSATSVNDRLQEFRSHWNSNMGSVSRHVAHLLTGLRSGAGGVAYLGQLCGGSFAYGVSGYMNGHFPYPLQHRHGQNWDVMVVAHEIGHNFNAPHTHSMSPPIDGCGNSDCSLANQGTIMSYCHTCSGGMSNIWLDLHSRIINERILPYLNSASCAASMLCPSDPGACCLPWGGCEFMDEYACLSIPDATFAGEHIPCASANCAPSGACCLADGSCVMVTESQCSSLFSGTFTGASNCGEGRCATAPVLWNHGPLATNPGAGCSGRDVSLVQPGNINRGWAWSLGSSQRIADEFIVPDGEEWAIDGIRLFGYHIDASSPNYTAARIQIWDGDPRDPASTVVAGNMSTNRLTNAGMTNMHRIRPGVDPMTSCGRRIQQLDCSFEATLGPGRYWIDRTASVTSGTPWIAPVTYAGLTGKPGGEALALSSGTWNVITDQNSSAAQAMPFMILGNRISGCYVDCDGNGVLTIDDFVCFTNEFAQAQSLPTAQQVNHYANCTGSTTEPVLTIDDFLCFINQFAQGCL